MGLDDPSKFHRIVSSRLTSARAFAPGGIGNLGPGLDILGCAVTGPGDAVRASFGAHRGVVVANAGHPDLSPDPMSHASAIASAEVLRRAAARDVGIVLDVEKGLPLAGGQGGSAASALAGAVATNALLGDPLPREALLLSALVAEERLAGRHIDNLAPQLFGGVLLIRSIDPPAFMSLPVPAALRVVLVHPHMQLRTAEARAVLPSTVDRSTALAQAAAVAAMVAAFCSGDLSQLRDAVVDRIAEPARAALLPGFAAAKEEALDAGALGCSISGGGPSAFALADGDHSARRVCDAMLGAYARAAMPASGRVAEIDRRGTRIVETT
jgi:homoserine kinase